MPTKLKLHEDIGHVFHALLQIPKGCDIFVNNLDSVYGAAKTLNEKGMKITGVGSKVIAKALHDSNNRTWYVVGHDDLSVFRPEDKFHLAFSMANFDVVKDNSNNSNGELVTKTQTILDKMMMFECSKGAENRVVPSQLLILESLLSSVMEGGYFAAVLPKGWIGRDMKFMRWWNNTAALVARIKLPRYAVNYAINEDGKDWENAPGDWELNIWQRPSQGPLHAPESSRHIKKTEYALFRYTPFIFSLETLSETDTDRCSAGFRRNDWWLNNVRLWRKMLDVNSQHRWCGTYRDRARQIPDPEDVWFFEPTPENIPTVSIVADVKKIRKQRFAIHVKPGPPVRLSCYSEHARAIMHDILVQSGITNLGDKGFTFTLLDDLSREHYSNIRETLIQSLCHRGLKPCMTKADAQKLKKSERWLQIQLTPIERQIPIRGQEHLLADSGEDEENGNGYNGGSHSDVPLCNRDSEQVNGHTERVNDNKEKDGDNGGETKEVNWEIAYEDMGMRSIHPEIIKMWESRAKRMQLHRYLFGFQFDDIVIKAAKQSVLNANVMGLGKTRETLFLPLLRCCKSALLIVPTKLIGVWQEEIENTIVPFVRRVRRNWQGHIMRADYRIINYAADILERNRAMFTIISYDKLKAIPRDGRFFLCPKCEFVTFTVSGIDEQPCPACNERRRKDWKEKCKEKGLRKHRVDITTGKKLPWKNPDKIRSRVIDPRPPLPSMVYMEQQDHVFKKMREVTVGTRFNPMTGVSEEITKMVPRPYHVGWTFANIVRWRFNFVAADEALYFKTLDAKRTKAMHHVCGRTRLALTGTPVKGYPQNILSLLNWTIDPIVFPSYRQYDPNGKRRFLNKYETQVKITDDRTGASKWKQVPKINNPELFQAELAPVMLRHTRNEPVVLDDIPKKNIEHKVVELPIDNDHRAYYTEWLAKFSEWWQTMKQEEEKRMVRPGEIITKLSYLRNASTAPHFMLDNISKSKDAEMRVWASMIGQYQKNKNKTPVAKMLKARELIKKALRRGDKVIVYSWRRKNLRLGKAWCDNVGISSIIVDGGTSLEIKKGSNRSPRQEAVDKFRHYDYQVMWAGMKALAEGMNIPEANWGIFLDYDWEPSEWKQALGRMIRPAQKKTVHARFLVHKGTIDSYMAALCFLKDKSAEEGVDYMEFDDFSVELIPDIRQYADAIVDGTEEIMKAKMWLAVDHIRKQAQDEE